MAPDELIPIAQHALYVLLLVLAPTVLPALIVGVVVGMFQAATSINEATIAFVPKLVITILCLMLFGGAIIGLMMDFVTEIFERIPEFAR